MLFQALTGGGQTQDRKKDEAKVPAGAPAMDAEMRLERELAVILSRKPNQKRKAEPADDFVDEAPYAGDDWDSEPQNYESATDEPADLAEAYRLDGEVDGPPVMHAFPPPPDTPPSERSKEHWMRSTRRNRRSKFFRKTASFVITLVVTAFIVSLVAVILFGMPKGVGQLFSNPANIAVVGQIKDPPSRLEWFAAN